MDQLAKYDATVRQDKCLIGVPEVDFNGHRLSAAGSRPLTSNVEAIQLLRFVCTASYYLKFVPEFAEVFEPLRQLLKADAVWNWSAVCQHSFELLKTRIISQRCWPTSTSPPRRSRPVTLRRSPSRLACLNYIRVRSV